MKLKKTSLATALVAALAMGAAGQASASVYAGSQLEISNLVLLFVDQTSGNTLTGINPSFTFNVDDSATLNGATDANGGACFGTPGSNNCGAAPVLGIDAANAPGSDIIRANNDYSLGGQINQTYANSNAEIAAAQLVTGTPTDILQVAEAEITGTGQAQALADIQSNTGFTLTFTVTNPGPVQLRLGFFADLDMEADVTLVPPNTLGLAQANSNVTFSLTQTQGGNGFATWTPRGTGADGICVNGLLCSNEINAETLNITLGAGPATSNTAYAVVNGQYQLWVSGLTAGSYTLTGGARQSVNVAQVPEPGTLVLIGGALAALGIGGVRRRRETVKAG